jgi:membrane protein YqaA with SNARE-associated domain
MSSSCDVTSDIKWRHRRMRCVKLLLSTFGFSFASALIPVLNAEVYLGAVGTQTTIAAAVGLSFAAALGQTLGKIVWYVAARRSIDSDWVQKKLDQPKVRPVYDRWHERTEGRPWYAAGIVFLAASLGVPPLLVLSVIAGSLKMRFWVFAVSCFVGRWMRFYFILAGVSFFTH